MKQHAFTGIIVAICIGVIGIVAWAHTQPDKPSVYDGFAQCLKDKGTTFYGAFWCPHCQEQKALFQGKSAVEKLPYTECSLPSGQGQTQVCIDAKITSYPTWQFKDGTRESKVLELADLAAKTGCELPATK